MVRLIGAAGEQVGIVTFDEALTRAKDAELDLVEIARNANPPVCRIMDYGKYQYEESKKERDAKKKQHHHKLKEIKFHPNVGEHDYATKLKHLVAFLEKGFKVKVSMFFRGREMAHTNLGRAIMDRVVEDTREVAIVETPVRRAGRSLLLYLAPAKAKPGK